MSALRWTPLDEQELKKLQARKADFDRVHRTALAAAFKRALHIEFTPSMVDDLIAHVDSLRDTLQPFDSGNRAAVAEVEP